MRENYQTKKPRGGQRKKENTEEKKYETQLLTRAKAARPEHGAIPPMNIRKIPMWTIIPEKAEQCQRPETDN